MYIFRNEVYFISFSFYIKVTYIIAEIRKLDEAKRKKKASESIGEPELIEKINNVIKDLGSFVLPAPPV